MKVNTKMSVRSLVAWAAMVMLMLGLVPVPQMVGTALAEEVDVRLGSDEEEGQRETAQSEDSALEAQVTNVNNPRIEVDSSMVSGQVVTWDCVWMGSYPQTEITASDSVYETLQNTSWDANGDAEVDGVKYRRLYRYDATYYGFWPNDSNDYRYFMYEPIKWRVLKVTGNTALVVADAAVDDQKYNTDYADVTWETSSMRSWLNGYAADINQPGNDYTSVNFINTAFSANEKSAILLTDVVNVDNVHYETPGGNNTSDKVFLLSLYEVGGPSATTYGFSEAWELNDEARFCKATDYAHAMGSKISTETGYAGNCMWWLRSSGTPSYMVGNLAIDFAANVTNAGLVSRYGYYVYLGDNSAVRPAMNIDLSSAYIQGAGTVSSKDGVTSGFSDVADQTAHREDIAWLASTGISKGWEMPDGTTQFRPYNNVARADMAAFLFRLAKNWGIVNDSWQPSGKTSFSDVSEKTSHYREIMWLAESEISKGWTMVDGTTQFRPYNNVARADMAAFICRLAKLGESKGIFASAEAPVFSDVSEKTAHNQDIAWLAQNGISRGWLMPNGTAQFRPLASVARADMAAFLHRLDGLR